MNISKINVYSPNFGIVKKSASILAKNSVKSSPAKLAFVNRLIQEQNDNKYFDITAEKQGSLNIYTVVSRKKNSDYVPESFYCFDDACYVAQRRRAQAMQSEMPC